MAETIVFYVLAGIILLFSTLTVSSRIILRAAVYLLFVLCATAGLYFMFEYNFLGAVQLTVYGGGIVVLVIFAVLLTSQIGQLVEVPGLRKQLFAGLAAFTGAILVISVVYNYEFPEVALAAGATQDVKYIGTQLLNYGDKGYALPFEVISVLLLAALIAAIVIAKKENTVVVAAVSSPEIKTKEDKATPESGTELPTSD